MSDLTWTTEPLSDSFRRRLQTDANWLQHALSRPNVTAGSRDHLAGKLDRIRTVLRVGFCPETEA